MGLLNGRIQNKSYCIGFCGYFAIGTSLIVNDNSSKKKVWLQTKTVLGQKVLRLLPLTVIFSNGWAFGEDSVHEKDVRNTCCRV